MAEPVFVCRNHWGDVVEHGDGLYYFLRGLERLVPQVAFVELCGECSFRDGGHDDFM